ncbi:hypothetical protein MNBD_GAMMA18-1489 [hydrothermal vent metagenome]|uniref:Uncharacterized protein n=1 Tax=hydrothermal vent metagenome TaxID=652676 RepID=A0A3B0ZM01_9ZZZZ
MTTNKFIGKLLKLKGLLVVSLALQKREQFTDRRQALQKWLPVPGVWQARENYTDFHRATLVAGYACGWLDGVVSILSARDSLPNPWARPGGDSMGRRVCTGHLSV